MADPQEVGRASTGEARTVASAAGMTSISVPTIDELRALIERAWVAGRRAAEEQHARLAASTRPDAQMQDYCGYGTLILKVDGRSALGKFLSSVDNQVSGVWIQRWGGREYTVHIYDMSNWQEMSVNVAAARAALEILTAGLGVEGHVSQWID